MACVRESLGASRHVLNACSDRYRFTVGLAAALTAGQVTLLPSTHTPEVIRQLRGFAPDAVCLTDRADCDIELPQVRYPTHRHRGRSGRDPAACRRSSRRSSPPTSSPPGPPARPSRTARPGAGSLQCVREEARRLGLHGPQSWSIVATVPAQHMYGFESSVLMALSGAHALCAERPFYPADIAASLAAVPRPRVLVSTPVHLRALLAAGVPLPPTDLVLSATAPLTQQLAFEVERRFATRLLEIYGSTETGQIATRRPTQGARVAPVAAACSSRPATRRPGRTAATSSSRRACATCSR